MFSPSSRRLGGRRAQHSGRLFEDAFAQACALNKVDLIRIPDGCRHTGKGLVRVNTPFDYILRGDGIAFVDTKTITAPHFTYSMIHSKPHQLKALKMAEGLPGHIYGLRAGFIVAYESQVVFYDVKRLIQCQPRGHLDRSTGVILGNRISFNPGLIF